MGSRAPLKFRDASKSSIRPVTAHVLQNISAKHRRNILDLRKGGEQTAATHVLLKEIGNVYTERARCCSYGAHSLVLVCHLGHPYL